MEWKLVPVEATPEMIEAAKDNRSSQPEGTLPGSAMRQMYGAMIAAAPTPPAQEEGNRLCPVCGAECMHVSIPNASWYKCKHCDWSAPPAQEDEPVAYVNDESLMRLEVIAASRNATRFFNIPLYLRTADDKLRKTAEEVCRRPQFMVDIMESIAHLRAALEETPTLSNTDKPSPD